MSLTSRIVNLFTPNDAPHFAPVNTRDSRIVLDGHGHGGEEELPLWDRSSKTRAMEEEEEEEYRAPYSHVSFLALL